MARWHCMAIKTIRQANQTGGNGPEIKPVPPCGIEACHQMQKWNYTSQLFRYANACTPQKISYMRRRIYMQSSSKRNTTQKSWIGFSPIGFDVTQAIFNSISRMQIASHSSTSQESTRQDMGGVSIAISNEQQASKW